MATKKKTKKKAKKKSGSKRTAAAKVTPKKKRAPKGKASRKLPKKKAAPKKAVATRKAASKATSRNTAARSNKKESRKKSQGRVDSAFWRDKTDATSGEQAGDLQGLSNVEESDSESVDELLEEGNAFEAGVVMGVEDAGERGVREVRTREVPEDDVPGEYLDED
jgi:hypothetical protein